MKLIYLKRRGGKTAKAIELCRKTGAVLVTLDAARKKHLLEARELPDRQLMTHDEFLREDRWDKFRGVRYPGNFGMSEFIIDDADLLLGRLANFGHVRGVTMSKPFTKAECRKMGMDPDGSRT